MTPPSVARPAAPAPPAAELEWTYYLASVLLGFGPLIALYYRASRFIKRFDVSILETTMRPNPRSGATAPSARATRRGCADSSRSVNQLAHTPFACTMGHPHLIPDSRIDSVRLFAEAAMRPHPTCQVLAETEGPADFHGAFGESRRGRCCNSALSHKI